MAPLQQAFNALPGHALENGCSPEAGKLAGAPWLKHPLRVTSRIIWLGGELLLAALSFVTRCAFQRQGRASLAARAAWLQNASRRCLRVLGIRLQASGPVPSKGLLVCNHLGYLDILVLAACTPAIFVAKQEVKTWPVFGWFASLAGTLFVNRTKRTQVRHLAIAMEQVLDQGQLVVLFPEGTSSDGQTILPFKSSLLETASKQRHAVSVGFLRYELDDGEAGEEVCYWKDMTLVPHLINLLSKRGPRAFVRFAPVRQPSSDRKELARQLRSEILSRRLISSSMCKVMG